MSIAKKHIAFTTTSLGLLAIVLCIALVSSQPKHVAADLNHENISADIASLLPIQRVKDIAFSEKPDATVAHIELEQEGANLLYKVQFSDGTNVAYSALTGSKIGTSTNKKVEAASALPQNFAVTIEFSKAKEIALSAKPNATINKIELAQIDHLVVYSIRFSDGSNVRVNAETGELLPDQTVSALPPAPAQQVTAVQPAAPAEPASPPAESAPAPQAEPQPQSQQASSDATSLSASESAAAPTDKPVL